MEGELASRVTEIVEADILREASRAAGIQAQSIIAASSLIVGVSTFLVSSEGTETIARLLSYAALGLTATAAISALLVVLPRMERTLPVRILAQWDALPGAYAGSQDEIITRDLKAIVKKRRLQLSDLRYANLARARQILVADSLLVLAIVALVAAVAIDRIG